MATDLSARVRRACCLLLACAAGASPTWTMAAAAAVDVAVDHQYVGRTFRIQAHLQGNTLRADRVQWRADQSNRSRVQLTGAVQDVEIAQRRMRIGGVEVRWTSEVEYFNLDPSDLRDGTTVRVTGKWSDELLIAQRLGADEAVDARTIRITGVVDAAEQQPDGDFRLTIAGIDVVAAMSGFNGVDSLIRRQDQRGSDSPVSRQLFGRDLGFTGKFELSGRERHNLALEDNNDIVDAEATLELGAYYRPGRRTTIYAALKASQTVEVMRMIGARDPPVSRVERDQSWLYFERIGGSGFGLQLGRQNFRETREWWWDDDLDAARLYYDRGRWHAELAVARELLPLSNKDRAIDPEQQGVTRTLGNLSWLWAPRQKFDAFYLHSDDRSGSGPVGSIIDPEREDGSDANLTWFGLRASGIRDYDDLGTVSYWADQAWVSGRERRVQYGRVSGGLAIGRESELDVSGQAVDLGLAWQAPWRHALSLGVSYARGSAGPAAGSISDGGFRQTGLHRNKSRVFGVNRYRSYGQVLRPELSNLAIRSARIGLPFRRNSSVELVWHGYRQLTLTDELRDIRIDADVTGRSPDVGSALDLVIGLRDSRSVDAELVVGWFRAGDAFGARSGEISRQVAFELAFTF